MRYSKIEILFALSVLISAIIWSYGIKIPRTEKTVYNVSIQVKIGDEYHDILPRPLRCSQPPVEENNALTVFLLNGDSMVIENYDAYSYLKTVE